MDERRIMECIVDETAQRLARAHRAVGLHIVNNVRKNGAVLLDPAYHVEFRRLQAAVERAKRRHQYWLKQQILVRARVRYQQPA